MNVKIDKLSENYSKAILYHLYQMAIYTFTVGRDFSLEYLPEVLTLSAGLFTFIEDIGDCHYVINFA